jgi:nucleoside-diphosphate-sugar epimerase
MMKVIVIGLPDPVACQAAVLIAAAGHQVTAVWSGGQQPCPQLARVARIVPACDTPTLATTCRGHDAICDLGTVPDTPASTCLHLLRARAQRSRQRQAAAAHAAIAASGVRRLIQRSAAAVYADGGHAWLDETSPVMPSPLIRGCLEAEAAAAGHAHRGGNAVVLRLGAVYGPDDPLTRALIRTARRGWQPFEGPRDAYRPTVSIQDAAAAVVRALQAPPGTYNVADTQPPTVEELNDILAIAVDARLHPLWPALRRADEEHVARSQRVSATVYQAAVGWTTSTSALQVLAYAALAMP